MQKLKNQKIKVVIAYDGTDFFGWQKQPEAVSISSTLEQAFNKVFGYQINLIAKLTVRSVIRNSAGIKEKASFIYRNLRDVISC